MEYEFKNESYIKTIPTDEEPVRGHRANLMPIMDNDWILDEKVFEEVIIPFINKGFITTNAELYMSSAHKEDITKENKYFKLKEKNTMVNTEYKSIPNTLYTNNKISFAVENACIDINLRVMKKGENKVTYAYEVPGMSIKCEEVFKNASKRMSLKFTGTGKILDEEVSFEKEIYIDTDIYNRYDWKVSMGVLYVTLFEIINERPDFCRVEKSHE